jgi:hypothetical protein
MAMGVAGALRPDMLYHGSIVRDARASCTAAGQPPPESAGDERLTPA